MRASCIDVHDCLQERRASVQLCMYLRIRKSYMHATHSSKGGDMRCVHTATYVPVPRTRAFDTFAL